MNLKQDFQNQIADQLFGANINEEKACFCRRFDPNNHPDNKISTNKKIAEFMKEDLTVYCEEKINQTIQKVIKVLHNAYEEEMKSDGVNTEALLNLKQGGIIDKEIHKKFSPWKEVHRWLWNYKFMRWLDQNYWSVLQERAKTASNWIQFKTETEMEDMLGVNKALIHPKPPISVQKNQQKIPVNQHLWMTMDLGFDNYQLLLLNRSQEAQCLLCPSSAYAPNPIIDQPQIWFPQKDSWAVQNKEKFMFGDIGKEEFLAIAVKEPLNLPWLTPKLEEALPEWNGERIKELFEQLAQQDNWQIFYQSFEVVERETEP